MDDLFSFDQPQSGRAQSDPDSFSHWSAEVPDIGDSLPGHLDFEALEGIDPELDLAGVWDLPSTAGTSFDPSVAGEITYPVPVSQPDWRPHPTAGPALDLQPNVPQNLSSTQYINNVNLLELLDGASRPAHPCNHCRKYRLQCLRIRTSPNNPNPIESCTSCVALYRSCSLAPSGKKRNASLFETNTPVAGHLHGVPEDDGVVEGSPPDATSRPTSVSEDEAIPTEPAAAKHFVRKGGRILKRWFDTHEDNPYPSKEDKIALEKETGFSQSRISTWFANARRRRKQWSQPINRPTSPRPGSSLTPMERWEASPPDQEPVPESVISNAYLPSPKDQEFSPNLVEMASAPDTLQSDGGTSYSASVSGIDSSMSSNSSAWSRRSSLGAGTDLPRRSRSRHRAHRGKAEATDRYQCTFCLKPFKKKHDWVRHEKSVHYPHDLWICTPNLDLLRQEMAVGPAECPWCRFQNPNEAHWEMHDFQSCADKPVQNRLFTRRDHLLQHLRKFHGCEKPITGMETWRHAEMANFQSRCGFCDLFFRSWSERADHLATHFKAGLRMSVWTGARGLGIEEAQSTPMGNSIIQTGLG